MKEILIVEDDMTLNEGIAIGLGTREYHFTGCSTLKEAYQAIDAREFQLVILDLNLPDGSGYDFLKEYRKRTDSPVLMLTANDLEMNEVIGFRLGVNDYVTKPFSLTVLRMRIENLLRLYSRQGGERFEDERYCFDFSKVRYEKDGHEVILSSTEQKLLQLLIENRGNTVKRDLLIERLWTDGTEFVDENALSVAVSRLRAKLEDDSSHPVHIRTVYGVGYVWK